MLQVHVVKYQEFLAQCCGQGTLDNVSNSLVALRTFKAADFRACRGLMSVAEIYNRVRVTANATIHQQRDLLESIAKFTRVKIDEPALRADVESGAIAPWENPVTDGVAYFDETGTIVVSIGRCPFFTGLHVCKYADGSLKLIGGAHLRRDEQEPALLAAN